MSIGFLACFRASFIDLVVVVRCLTFHFTDRATNLLSGEHFKFGLSQNASHNTTHRRSEPKTKPESERKISHTFLYCKSEFSYTFSKKKYFKRK